MPDLTNGHVATGQIKKDILQNLMENQKSTANYNIKGETKSEMECSISTYAS